VFQFGLSELKVSESTIFQINFLKYSLHFVKSKDDYLTQPRLRNNDLTFSIDFLESLVFNEITIVDGLTVAPFGSMQASHLQKVIAFIRAI